MGVRLREFLSRRRSRRKVDFQSGDLKSSPGLVIQQADIDNVLADIAQVLLSVDNKKTRKEILEKAAAKVRDAAKLHPAVQPGKIRVIKGKRVVSARYNTPKLTGKLKAPSGQGVVRSFIMPGNLRKSIQILKLKRTTSVFVGPQVLRSTRKYFGKTQKSASGFYAQMLFGSASAFQKRVMVGALNRVKGQVRSIIEREAQKILREEAKKRGLQ